VRSTPSVPWLNPSPPAPSRSTEIAPVEYVIPSPPERCESTLAVVKYSFEPSAMSDVVSASAYASASVRACAAAPKLSNISGLTESSPSIT